MNGKIVSLAVLLLLAGSFSAQAANNSGQLRFSGQIVESACDIGRQTNSQVEPGSRLLKVSSGLSLSVDTLANACRDGRVPFSASYQALASSVAPRQAVVIITYN
ncbi:type 1 fimbrial protein [Pseudomonas sp. MWU13-2105]|uniref:type 1 fimbrial protein n=1 Tax=Pseudomonas sp. MWU13-2105 TaxID=2935074 RepID=UPI00200D23B2|nr:type 1 fimbrial protein [Pseudomonas sp. MWU13-2105]